MNRRNAALRSLLYCPVHNYCPGDDSVVRWRAPSPMLPTASHRLRFQRYPHTTSYPSWLSSLTYLSIPIITARQSWTSFRDNETYQYPIQLILAPITLKRYHNPTVSQPSTLPRPSLHSITTTTTAQQRYPLLTPRSRPPRSRRNKQPHYPMVHVVYWIPLLCRG